ncbi:MAG: glycoside hydrolase family 57 protein [Bacillota bacterium]
MTEKVLYIAFVWNQHQPYYRDEQRGLFIMPWVRLHAAKDYYRMASILEQYPEIRATFSLSPSLLDQLEGYIEEEATDLYLNVMKKARELDEREQSFLLRHYFDIQHEKVIAKYPYYRQLLERRGFNEPHADELEKARQRYTVQDYLDLQVWFNLVWIDPEIRRQDAFLRGLEQKGRNFSEKEKEELIKYHFSLMEDVVPVHRRLQKKEQIEIITTAYYHPIIPLLVDNYTSLRATPGLPLPQRFSFPEDARAQVEMAAVQYRRLFDAEPRGFWPPEMAVSPETIPLLADLGFAWTITDEQILARSLDVEIYRDGYGHVLNPEVLYQPYLACGEGAELPVIFRDHHLSDRIGFVYQHMAANDAAADLVHRLQVIRDKLQGSGGSYLVTIALDGENAWEWYAGEKNDFLHALYRSISSAPYLETVTVADYLAENPPKRRITHLATGSWVDHNLARWIGTEHKNRLWDCLLETRQAVKKWAAKSPAPHALKKSLRSIYKAEGSDFTWWMDSMPYHLAAPFEVLFRQHLADAYLTMEMRLPSFLAKPLLKAPPGEEGRYECAAEIPVCMVPTWKEK